MPEEIKKTADIFGIEQAPTTFLPQQGGIQKTSDIFGDTQPPTEDELEYEAFQSGDKWWSPFARFGKSFQAGFFGGFSKIAGALDKASIELAELGEKKLGIPEDKLRGGIFGILSEKWEHFSKELKEKGAKGIEGEVFAGLGQAVPDIGAIMTLGGYGLPIYGGLMGAAEGGKEGAAVGAIRGAITHKVIRGIGLLPSIARLPAWAGFGAVSTPGELKDKVAGGITWTVLGMAGGSKKLTIREFAENYPKTSEKIGDWKAVGMLKRLAPDITVAEMKEAGGAKKVLNDVVMELNKLPEPEVRKTEQIKFEPLEKIVEKRMKTYPGFPKDAPDIWHEVMEHGGIKRPKFEVEEFEGNVPKQLRRETGLKPDDMAARLGLEDTTQLYDKLERMGAERITEKPAGEIRLEHEEYLAKELKEVNFIKAEEDILRETGYKSPEIQRFIEHEFLDGKELRATVEDVLSGKTKRADAVTEIKGLIKSVTGKEPPKPELFEQKLIEKQIEETPSQQELKAEGTESALIGLPLQKEARTLVQKIVDTFQIEPQFKRVNAPGTGNAFKTFHAKIDGELDRTLVDIKQLGKTRLTKAEFKELTFVSARPGKFWKMDKETRTRFSPAYQIVRKFFDRFADKLKQRGIITEEWPQSAIRRMEETKDANIRGLNKGEFDPGREIKVKKEIDDINVALEFLKRTRAQYVHVPRTWMEAFWAKQKGTAPTVISQFFKQRNTYDIEELSRWLIKNKYIKPEATDIRIIMAEYAHKTSRKLAISDIFNMGKKEGLIRADIEAPVSWQYLDRKMFPTMRGKKVAPMFADFFEKNLTAKKFMPPNLSGALGLIKMWQFYNPLFLPGYDIVQSFWSGALTSPKKLPKSIYGAYKNMFQKNEGFWDAHHHGLFSTPFTPNFKSFMKDAKLNIDKNIFLRSVKKYIPNIYRASWEAAWGGDKFIRLITYNHYLQKGFSPKDAAQTAATLHADYANVPPATRQWLNKLLFTPSFKISMMAAQTEMIKSAGKELGAAAGLAAPTTTRERAMAKALVGLTSGILLRNYMMKKLGFEEDKFGLKYIKQIITEEGFKKELVLHTASPDNVFLRYYHRFKGIPMNQEFVGSFFSRAKWELHPAWQLGIELFSNRGVTLEPIYNKFDDPWKIARDIGIYTTGRIVRATEQIGGMADSTKRLAAQKELSRDLGKIASVLKWFSLPYLRNPRQKRVQYEINDLIREFKFMERESPARSIEELEKRQERLRKKIQKIARKLKDIE